MHTASKERSLFGPVTYKLYTMMEFLHLEMCYLMWFHSFPVFIDKSAVIFVTSIYGHVTDKPKCMYSVAVVILAGSWKGRYAQM